MGYDVLLAGLTDAITNVWPDELTSGTVIIAADTSETASGGGVFVPLAGGRFKCKKFIHHIVMRTNVVGVSSALCEL